MSVRDEWNAQPPQRRWFLFGSLLVWCVGLIGVRVGRTGSGYFLFLIWNLFLACIPLLASRLLCVAHHRCAPAIVQLSLFAMWLLFLPNAPYLLTDFVHLHGGSAKLFWYDFVMLSSAAGTGLLLGYASLLDVHKVLEDRFGYRCGWLVAIGSLILSGYGVYLGRVLRWNSWDVITNPLGLLAFMLDCVLHPSEHFHTYMVSGLFAVMLLSGYAVLHFMMRQYSVLRVLAPAPISWSPPRGG